MLTNKQNFRLGFLQKCADAGLTTDEAADLAERATALIKRSGAEAAGAAAPAAMTLAGLGSLLLNNPLTAGVGELSKNLGGYAIPMALGGPPVLGALGGHFLAKATDVDDETIKAIRKREMIDEIRRNRQILEQKRRTYRPSA